MPPLLGIAIVDRSVLGHNLLHLVLKPKGFSCYDAQNIDQLKILVQKKLPIRAALINSNTFKDRLDHYFEWFQEYPAFKTLPKIFLCRDEGEARRARLLHLPAATVLDCPFHPDELYEVLQSWR